MKLAKLAETWEEPGSNLVENIRNKKHYIHTMSVQPEAAPRPLETIPEETTAPAPARVTADPPKTKPATEKNPGRVASGKRLAERNRLARAAKKTAEAAKQASTPSGGPAQPSAAPTPAESGGQSSNSTFLVLGIGGLLVCAAGVYYQREAIMERLKPAPAPPARRQPQIAKRRHRRVQQPPLEFR